MGSTDTTQAEKEAAGTFVVHDEKPEPQVHQGEEAKKVSIPFVEESIEERLERVSRGSASNETKAEIAPLRNSQREQSPNVLTYVTQSEGPKDMANNPVPVQKSVTGDVPFTLAHTDTSAVQSFQTNGNVAPPPYVHHDADSLPTGIGFAENVKASMGKNNLEMHQVTTAMSPPQASTLPKIEPATPRAQASPVSRVNHLTMTPPLSNHSGDFQSLGITFAETNKFQTSPNNLGGMQVSSENHNGDSVMRGALENGEQGTSAFVSPTTGTNNFVQVRPRSLAASLFRIFFFIIVLLFWFGYGTPLLMEYLVSANYVTVKSGAYTYNQMTLPTTLPSESVHLGILFGAVGIIVIFLGVLVDILAKKTSFVARVFIFIFLLLALTSVAYYATLQGIDILGYIRAYVRTVFPNFSF